MSNPCNCYYGEDCTKTTVCAINAALEDQADEIEHMQKVIDRVALIRLDLESENRRLSTESSKRERLVRLVSWLKPNDYGTGFYCSEEICEEIIDLMDDVESFQDLDDSASGRRK